MGRISNFAPVGSLLKQPRARKPRSSSRGACERDEGHLALIRKLPCLKCGQDPCGVAAHVRMASAPHGKPNAGMGVKPDDQWTVPLCDEHHREQHQLGELQFWHEAGVSPVLLALQLYTASPDLERMRAVVFSSRRGV